MTITDEISTKPVPMPGFDYAVRRVAYSGGPVAPVRQPNQPAPKPKQEWRAAKPGPAQQRHFFVAYVGLPEQDHVEDAKCLAAVQKTTLCHAAKTSDTLTWPVVKCGEAPFDKTVKKILKEFTLKTWKAQARDEVTRPLLLQAHECGGQSNLKQGRWIASNADDTAAWAAVTRAHHAAAGCAHSPGVRTRWLEKIVALGRLEKGWNGYRAPAPASVAVGNAKDLFEAACVRDIMPERVDASAMGGVGMTFTTGDREVVAELYNNGTAHALFADSTTEEMDTRPISPTAEGYDAFLDEVRRYLYGQAPIR